MFLVQYQECCFIDASKITVIYKTEDGCLRFETVNCRGEERYCVEPEYVESFLNNIQACNENISNIVSSLK